MATDDTQPPPGPGPTGRFRRIGIATASETMPCETSRSRGLPPADLIQALLIRYDPGAGRLLTLSKDGQLSKCRISRTG